MKLYTTKTEIICQKKAVLAHHRYLPHYRERNNLFCKLRSSAFGLVQSLLVPKRAVPDRNSTCFGRQLLIKHLTSQEMNLCTLLLAILMDRSRIFMRLRSLRRLGKLSTRGLVLCVFIELRLSFEIMHPIPYCIFYICANRTFINRPAEVHPVCSVYLSRPNPEL